MLNNFLLFDKMDQGNCIKFCVKNYIKCARTFEMLTVVFGKSTMSRTQVQLCYNWFQETREDVNDDACPDRLSTSTAVENIEAVKNMILYNRRIVYRVVVIRLLMMLSYRSTHA